MSCRIASFVAAFILAGLGPARAEEVISTTHCRVKGIRGTTTIQIVMTDGRFYNDDVGWAGGGKKWEGQFAIRISNHRKLLSSASLNRLMHSPDSIFFWAPKFKLALGDYNGDGRIDFNLGQYGNSVSNNYRLFTIRRDGTIAELSCEGSEDGLEVGFQSGVNSTPDINARHGLVTCSSYERSPERCGDYTDIWSWKRDRFVLSKHRLGVPPGSKRDPGGEAKIRPGLQFIYYVDQP